MYSLHALALSIMNDECCCSKQNWHFGPIEVLIL